MLVLAYKCLGPLKLCHYLLCNGDTRMARSRYWDEEALKIFCEIHVHLNDGLDLFRHGPRYGHRVGYRREYGTSACKSLRAISCRRLGS